MWNQLLEKLSSLDPGVLKNAVLLIAGGFTGLVSTLMGEHKSLFYWLFAFVVFDYLTGMIAAARTGTLSSRIGLIGVVKKLVILLIAIGFHGIDQIFAEPWIGAGACGALSLNALSSRIGLIGVVKKLVILLIAIGFHGIDQIFAEPWIGAGACGALSLNELISILENVERAGFGSIIPSHIRQMLDVVKTQEENKLKQRCGMEEKTSE